MTTPPPGEAGWEQRLENLARAQEWAAELREAIRQCLDDEVLMATGRSVGDIASGHVADALLAGPLAPLLEAQAAVQRVRAIADDIDPVLALTVHARSDREIADRLRRAIDVDMPVRPLSAAVTDGQARAGVRGSGRCGATEGDS